jgi:hypothetical protein
METSLMHRFVFKYCGMNPARNPVSSKADQRISLFFIGFAPQRDCTLFANRSAATHPANICSFLLAWASAPERTNAM